MWSYRFYLPALIVATVSGVLVPVSLLSDELRLLFVRPTTIVTVALCALFFLRLLLDPECHRRVAAANKELSGEAPLPGKLRFPFFDADWGLFGSRMGGRDIQLVRAVLFFEFVTLLIFGRAFPDVTILAAASFGLTVTLTLHQIAVAPPADH